MKMVFAELRRGTLIVVEDDDSVGTAGKTEISV